MRFIELHLKAFGHFKDRDVKLDPPRKSAGGLHLLVGANEAGKSTTLEAISRLMFGFPRGEEKYGFEHSKTKLKVGARIRRGDQEELTLWRTKTGNALTLADGKSPAPMSMFEDMLDSLPPETYWKLFSLNQEKLRSGGRELVLGKGDFSRILFGESLGELESFTVVRQRLIDEAATIFKPGGKNAKAPLNQLKTERDLLKTELETATTTRERWLALTEDLRKTQARIEKLESTVEEVRIQQDRLERVEKSREPIAALDQLNRAMDGFRELPEVSERLRDDFIRLVQQRKDAARTIASAGEEIAKRAAEIDSIDLDEELLARGASIVELAREAVIADQRRSRIDERRSELAATLAKIQENLRTLGFDPDAPERIPVCEKARKEVLDRIKRDLIDSESQIDRAEQAIAEKRLQLEKAEFSLSQSSPDSKSHAAGIEAAAARMEGLLPHLSRIGTLRDQIAKWNRQRQSALDSLPYWSGSWDDFAKTQLPDFELVNSDAEHVESRWREREEARIELEKSCSDLAEKRAIFENRLQQHRIPSPEELTVVRSHRDRHWTEIRTRWLFGETTNAGGADSGLGDSSLADIFEREVERADQIADILRQHLETVDLLWQCKDIEARIPILEGKLAACETAWLAARDRWAAHFRFLAKIPQRPDEMRSWPATVDTVRDLTEEIESARNEIDRIEHDWFDCRDHLVLPLIPEFSAAEVSFEFCREKFKALRESMIDTAATRSELERQAKTLRSELEQRQRDLEDAKVRHASFASDWTQALDETGLPNRLMPESLDAFVSELAAVRRDFGRFEIDRTEFETDLTRLADFASRVTALAQEVRFSDPEVDPIRLAESMKETLDEHRNRDQRRRNAGKSLELERKRQREAEMRLAEAAGNLDEICRLVGADTLDDASERFEAIAERGRLQTSIDQRIVVLKTHARDEPLEHWIQAVRDLAPERSAQLAADLRRQFDEAKTERTELWNHRFALESDLNRIEAGIESSQVLVAEEKRKVFFETSAGHMARYLKCLLTSRVLKDASEEYRRRMGEQVIELASANFRTLTLGSFAGVSTLADDDSGRRLVAVRGGDDGSFLELDQLSEGTQDQLFLALKIAMIQNRMIERASKGLEPLPVIFDDILVQFDDARAAAAFELLAELAKSTQVIYLTHHRHLVDVARSALKANSFDVRPLTRTAESVESADSGSRSSDTGAETTFLRFLEDLP